MSSTCHGPENNPPVSSTIASGEGWSISDVLCNAGPQDRPFEEQHSQSTIAVVVSGTFQYRTSIGRSLMTPGSILLANPGDCFCCGHEHGRGDRCISFTYTLDFLERVTAMSGHANARFRMHRIPALRVAAMPVVRATAYLLGDRKTSPEELSIFVAGEVAEFSQNRGSQISDADSGALSRVTRVVRMIDLDASAPRGLTSLAEMARLSPYHFLRTFEGITGSTPHQYVLRGRLRRAALRLMMSKDRVVDIALDCGFGDISNFNRTFRAEFGMTPRHFRNSGARRDTK